MGHRASIYRVTKGLPARRRFSRDGEPTQGEWASRKKSVGTNPQVTPDFLAEALPSAGAIPIAPKLGFP